MTDRTELQRIMDTPGFGSGRAFLERKTQEREILALLPDPVWMTPVMAVSESPMDNWVIASFGNSNEDGKDWHLVTDCVRASILAHAEFPEDAKLDALRVAAILNAYRLGLLVRADNPSIERTAP